jgi:hypothetical protein
MTGTITAGAISASAISPSNIVVPGYIRNALTPTTLDMSGGNISNSGTTSSSNFIGSAIASNSIGGVTLSNANITYAGSISNSSPGSNNSIGGVIIGNNAISNAGTTTSGGFISAAATSNSIGGVTLSNSNVINGNGTAAIPSYTFSTDLSTGMYRTNTDQLGFAVGGSNRMNIFNDRVAINALGLPKTRFQVNPAVTVAAVKTYDASAVMFVNPKPSSTTVLNDPTPVLYLGREGTSAQAYGSLATLHLSRWEDNGVNSRTRMDITLTHDAFNDVSVMTLRSDGRVGIGTQTPSTALTVAGDISASGFIRTGAGTVSAPAYSFNGDVSMGMFQSGTNALGFVTQGVARMTICGDAVGIGTTSPARSLGYLLDICGGGIHTRVDNTPGFALLQTFANSGYAGTTDVSLRRFGLALSNVESGTGTGSDLNLFTYSNNGTNGKSVLTVQRSGNVGIGTSNPTALLDVSGGQTRLTNTAAALALTSATGSNFLTFQTVAASQRWGIGLSNAESSGNAGSDFILTRSDDLGVQVATPSIFVKRSNGNVGIGTSNPVSPLTVAGDISAGGTLTFPTSAGKKIILYTTGVGGTMGFEVLGGQFRQSADAAGTAITWGYYTGTTFTERMRLVNTTGSVGIGTSAPAYTLDVSTAANSAAVNMSTWSRVPISNTLILRNIAGGGLVGNTINFESNLQAIDSNLATIVSSNATSGSSFIIKKSGIWSISWQVNCATAAFFAFIDVSTTNHSNISFNTNGNPVLAMQQARDSNTLLSWTGYLPSNDSYFYKMRASATPGNLSNGVHFIMTFLAETPTSASTFPF